jgi:hypothetical protein
VPGTRLRPAALAPLAALALLAGCAGTAGSAGTTGGAATGSPSATPGPATPAPAGQLVLRVDQVGGFTAAVQLASRLPLLAVYGDGRVLTQGLQPAIYPPPALPSVQVQQVDAAAVGALAQRARDAGVGGSLDLGRPPVADAATTRFTLVTDGAPAVLDAYALREGARSEGGLTAEQQAARDRLRGLLDALSDLPGTLGADAVHDGGPYRPSAVAAVVVPWTDPGPGRPASRERPWPGPALPGQPLPAGPVAAPAAPTCVTATGDQARAVLDAAGAASAVTPWTTPDGGRWSVTLRPLLPDESGCADLGR